MKDLKGPTDLWFSYLEKRDGHSVPLSFMRDVVLPDLRRLGYQAGVKKDIADTLTRGMEPLPVVESGKQGGMGRRLCVPSNTSSTWYGCP